MKQVSGGFMQILRSRVVIPVLLGLVAVVAASIASASVKSTRATTLTFWQTMNEQETGTLKSLVNKFEASHSSIKVDVVYVPFDQRDAKFTAAAQAGKAPDVMRAEIADVANWAAQGFLADVSKKVSAADKADYLPSAFAYDNYGGKIWGIPQVTDAPALLYNKKMLKAAGIKAPPATMGQLAAACNKLGKGKGIFLRGDSYFVQPWIWAYGGDLLNYTKKQILIADKRSVAGMTAYKALFKSKCAFADKDFANDYGNMQTAFKNGQVAMIVNGPWATADILQGRAFKNRANLGIAPLPAGPKGQGSPVGGHSYVISRSSTSKAAAYTFIQWIDQAFNQEKLAVRNNLLPTRQSTYARPAVKRNRILQAFLAQMKVARNRPVTPAGGSIYVDFGPNIQKILTGKATPAQGMLAVARAWKSKLFKNYTIVR
jgi:arabinogalactan oligomer / maltooligosaccharide transport system substrate-binding protein